MTDFILFGKCEACPRKRFFIRKRTVPTPLKSITARSQLKICNSCHKKVLTKLQENTIAYEGRN